MVTGPSQPISHRSSDLTLVSHPSPARPYLFITCLIVTMSISKLTSFFVPPLSPEALHLWCFPLPDSRVIHVWGVLWPGQRLQGDSNSDCDIQIASLCDCLESGAITGRSLETSLQSVNTGAACVITTQRQETESHGVTQTAYFALSSVNKVWTSANGKITPLWHSMLTGRQEYAEIMSSSDPWSRWRHARHQS